MWITWQRTMAARGGVASTAQLHALGLDDHYIRICTWYRTLLRVRRGWYAQPQADPAAVEACRLGGRLACVSALKYHGQEAEDDGRLHIEVRANAVPRPETVGNDAVRVHWTRHPSPGDQAAVAVPAARRQAERCAVTG
jgi:hypothetical protein